jgi:hypothetical protein
MIINNNFDTIIETEQIKNPLIPFFVEGNKEAIKVGILPGTVLFLATKKTFSPVKDVLYFNCIKDDGIYLNLNVGIKKTPIITKINWKDPDVYINCVLDPDKEKRVKENEEQIKYAEKQISILNQEIKDLQDELEKGLKEIDENITQARISAEEAIADIIANVENEIERQLQIDEVNDDLKSYIETQEALKERLKAIYAERIENKKCRQETSTTTTTTAAPTETTSTTTTASPNAPEKTDKERCIEQYKTQYKPINFPKPSNRALTSICAWQREIDRLTLFGKKIIEAYNQNVAYEKEDSIRYGKHNKVSITNVSISMSKENNLKEEDLFKETDEEIVYKFLLAKIEERDGELFFTSTKFEFPQLLIGYGLSNEPTETFKNRATVSCVYPDVKKYTKVNFFLTSI